MIKIILRIIGCIFYWVLKSINLRFLLPQKSLFFLDKLRINSLRLQGSTLGRNANVRNDVFIAYPKNFSLGDNVTLGSYARIFNYSNFIVGDNTEIGPGLHVQTNEHIWTNVNEPICKQGSVSNPVKIGSDVYVGANVTILQGVEIANHCVIAAGAVVNKSTESGYLYGGVPAKKIRPLTQSKGT
jgi:acetyltransferase-like isoleucine patch superfamily enzyme